MATDMTLRERILMRLVDVIDPETGVDVLRMRLVEDLEVDEATGLVSYTFRPSSPLCPLAHSLAMDLKRAVASVHGVAEQKIHVAGYVRATELTEMVNRSVI
ncbi:MAG: iron-sulfur cluster assembly protein [Anaerolineae bacterium]|jgi:metal-sulfur cluster biosynthetic enzyme|nr:iron-sulfur cluster assembly protein [Anaerolineae bacterium]